MCGDGASNDAVNPRIRRGDPDSRGAGTARRAESGRADAQRLWAEEFIVNSPINQIAPSQAIVVDLMRRGLIHYSSFDRSIEQLRIAENVAIVMGAETVQPAGNAPMAGQTVRRRFTHIWQRNAGIWRLIARHANNIPPT